MYARQYIHVKHTEVYTYTHIKQVFSIYVQMFLYKMTFLLYMEREIYTKTHEMNDSVFRPVEFSTCSCEIKYVEILKKYIFISFYERNLHAFQEKIIHFNKC
jgi:hypothetical protein